VSSGSSADLRDFWTRCLPQLAAAFQDVCAYACVRIDPVTGAPTVDHFRPKENAAHQDLAYEWSNYRYACKTLNTWKGTDEAVCDPFAVQDGWFVVNLVTFAIGPAPGLPPAVNARVVHTIARLRLDSDLLRRRREAAWRLFEDDWSVRGWAALQRDCPLVAREFSRQRGLPSFPLT
jgi:hypothetical protein